SVDESLLSGSRKSSGGVSDNQIAIITSKSIQLQRSVTSVEQSLVSEKPAKKSTAAITDTKTDTRRKSGVRSEESVTLVFDRNKSKLFALYNRARRKNPNLEGKVILELTIAPSGKVTRIIIVTSELNDKSLESRLLKRIKQFDFGAQAVEQVTVTYPVEFLPS
ncbi:MAG: TonB family protein, partial [Gammaproteobacteria bacterium]|nr:TonB family protein [Gammaproteobacteria bacterium]